ncbi:MAG TPA: hypothetical protein PL029_08730 [Bacteroidia bacterium]|nr:hypothetical protein [Bacteroidia bacterium]
MITGKRRAISNLFRQFDIFIDVEQRLYKIQNGLFGILRWGNFQPLPKIDYVLVFRSFFVKCEACVYDDTIDNPNAYFQVSLVYNKNRRIIIDESKNKKEAFALAKEAAGAFKTRIMDSATQPGKGTWLSLNQ